MGEICDYEKNEIEFNNKNFGMCHDTDYSARVTFCKFD